MEKFLIIDGNSLAFRAFYALPFLTSSAGTPTGAIFGFLNMLTKVLEEAAPTHVVVAFDFGRKTFRNDIFAEYKGTRKETPEELREQFPILKNLLKTMKIQVVEKEGFEADDIIGTFSKTLSGEKIVLSGDRDLLQLITPETQVWLTHKGISEIHKMDEEALLRDWGVEPWQIVELKALMGDASDNIPGVAGIGPKTATNLIQAFGSVENLYENLDKPPVTPKLREKLEKNKEMAFISQTLATIKTDCEVAVNIDDCRLNLPFCEEAVQEIRGLDMGSLLKKKAFFDYEEVEPPSLKALEEKSVSSLGELEKLCQQKHKEMAFHLGQDLAFSFGEEFWYKIESEITLFSQPPEISECLKVLGPLLMDEGVSKVVCGFKNQRHLLEKYGIDIKGEVFDISLANYLVGQKPEDCTLGRFFSQKVLLEQELVRKKLDKIYYEMELPLESVLFDMENAGFMVDREALVEYGKELDEKLKSLTKSITQMAGQEFSLTSPRQTASVLFDTLGLPTENNPSRSTNVDVLQDLIEMHPIVAEILHFRKLQKIKSTYVDAFLQKLEESKTNLIHTVFNQTLATTGRLSSSEPNLQNLPVRDDEGKELRRAFISRFEGGSLVSADYNQIELRLLAHLSEDENLIEAFNSGEDVHATTAMQMFGLKKDEVTPQLRRQAKAINFGIIYGISSVGLAQNTGISRHEAKEYIDKYFEVYPTVRLYLDKNVEKATRKGYAETLFGRRRKIDELKSNNHQARQFGQRVAKNMPMQGSASDIIKFAMLKVADAIKKQNLKSKLILQIHDELVVDCPPKEVEIVKKLLKTAMESVVNLSVKLPVSVESGATYFDI